MGFRLYTIGIFEFVYKYWWNKHPVNLNIFLRNAHAHALLFPLSRGKIWNHRLPMVVDILSNTIIAFPGAVKSICALLIHRRKACLNWLSLVINILCGILIFRHYFIRITLDQIRHVRYKSREELIATSSKMNVLYSVNGAHFFIIVHLFNLFGSSIKRALLVSASAVYNVWSCTANRVKLTSFGDNGKPFCM